MPSPHFPSSPSLRFAGDEGYGGMTMPFLLDLAAGVASAASYPSSWSP